MLNLTKDFSNVVSEDFIEKQDTEGLTNYLLECYADDCNGMSDDELLIHYITQEMVFHIFDKSMSEWTDAVYEFLRKESK